MIDVISESRALLTYLMLARTVFELLYLRYCNSVALLTAGSRRHLSLEHARNAPFAGTTVEEFCRLSGPIAPLYGLWTLDTRYQVECILPAELPTWHRILLKIRSTAWNAVDSQIAAR